MSGIKGLVGKKMSKSIKFMGENINIFKLSVSQVMEIQALARVVEANAKDQNKIKDTFDREQAKLLLANPEHYVEEYEAPEDLDNIKLLRSVVRMSVEGAEELTDEDFQTFPMDELAKLSNDIMVFSGVSQAEGK